jgi:hypothetical protein
MPGIPRVKVRLSDSARWSDAAQFPESDDFDEYGISLQCIIASRW